MTFATLTVVTWSLTGIFVRMLPGFSSTFLTGARLLIAFAGLAPVLLLSSRWRALRSMMVHAAAWRLSLALIAYYLLAVTAYQFGTVAEVALFIATSPMFVLIARRLKGNTIEAREKIGAVAALAGVAVVMLPNISAASPLSGRRIVGDCLALLAALASAVYASEYRATAEREHLRVDPIVVAGLTFAAGSLLLVPALAFSPALAADSVANSSIVLKFVGLGLVSTAVPSIAYALASQKLPPVITTTTQLMIPVFSTAFAAAFLREIPSVWLIPGGFLVLFGIAYMMRGPAAKQREYVVPE